MSPKEGTEMQYVIIGRYAVPLDVRSGRLIYNWRVLLPALPRYAS